MKYHVVKKRLLMESLATAGALTLGVGILFLLISMHDEYTVENLSLQTKLTELNNEQASMNDKFTRIQKHRDLYEEAKKKSENDQLAVNSEIIVKLLREYRNRNGVKSVDIQMSPTIRPANPIYNKKTARVAYSEVSLKIGALTDEEIYRFLSTIYQGFPGVIKVTGVALTRDNKFSKEAALEIASKGYDVQLVSAEVKFNWFGIDFIESADGAGGNQNAP